MEEALLGENNENVPARGDQPPAVAGAAALEMD
jgi:hypothetical protein